VRYLSNTDVQAVLDMRTCLSALRAGYEDLARGDAAYVPRIDLFAPTGRPADYYCLGTMAGVCRSTGVAALRIKSDILAWPDGQTQEKYCVEPGTYSGVILLYGLANGEPLALINDGYLQHLRVGGCAALGVDVLARQDTAVVGLLGSGGMARTYLEAIALVRPLHAVKVYSPTPEHRQAYAEEMAERVGVPITPVESAEIAVRGSDIVVTATDSMRPTFSGEWVDPGTHITCVTRRELDQSIVRRADVVAQLGVHTIVPEGRVPGMEWPQSGVAGYVSGQPDERQRLGQRHAAETGDYPSLMDITRGLAPGRTDPSQVSLFINTGTQGLQFAAVAGRAYHLACERGLGQTFPREWFLQDIRD
jgi:alanine dehydrogenase